LGVFFDMHTEFCELHSDSFFFDDLGYDMFSSSKPFRFLVVPPCSSTVFIGILAPFLLSLHSALEPFLPSLLADLH
jgi:hypothetical protein